jgi:ribosomal protein RSM22 (predicted rRNA methylase)
MPLFRELSPAVLQSLSAVSGLHLLDPYQPVAPSLTGAITRLSAKFNHGDAAGKVPYLEESSLRLAYLAYFLPVNLVKVQLLLDEAGPAISPPTDGPFRVLDVGGGPGTGVLALLDWVCSRWKERMPAIDCTVVDHSSQALMLCERLWREYKSHCSEASRMTLRLMECNVEKRLPQELQPGSNHKSYDLILMENVLSELHVGHADMIDRRTALVSILLNYLTPQGTLIIIEPALRSASRELHLIRDRLLQQGSMTIYSPCLHQHSCPALLNQDDWCHEERSWVRSDWIKQVDQAVGFIKDALKFSYLILRKDGKTLVPRSADLHRVVSELRIMKGEKRVWWCDETGRPEVGRLDREWSETNAPLDHWHRGAIVRVSEIVRKERKGRPGTVGRIPASATVEIVRPV